MIVDAHQHVYWNGRDDAGLVADLDRHGIDLAWLLTWEIAPEEWADLPEPMKRGYVESLNPVRWRADGSHPGILLEDLLAARANHPDRFVVGYCPNPMKAQAAAALESAVRIWQVRVCGEWKCRMLLDDPRCLNLFRKAGELKCPVVIHLQPPYLRHPQTGRMEYQPEWYGGTIANLERAARACPETVFLGHGPGFWREIGGEADAADSQYPTGKLLPGGRLERAMAEHPNLWADLSAGSGLGALRRDPGYAKGFLTRFADRVLFARDYFGGDLREFLDSLGLARSVRAKILGGNALRLVPPSEARPGGKRIRRGPKGRA